VIEGVTLNLRDTSASTVTLQVTNDVDTVKANLKSFVEAYNKVYSYINGQFQYVEGVGSGILAGEYILRDLQGQLAQIVGGSVAGVGTLSSLGLLGIEMKNDGTLTIDSTVLDENLSENFDAVKSLFVAVGTPTHSKISYVTAGSATQPGTYQVDITALAEAATITSPNSIGPTLGVDETLTFTMGSKSSQILLNSGMDLDAIVDALNSAFDADGLALTASKSGSQLVVTSDKVGHTVSFSVVSDVDSGGTGIGTSGLSDSGASVAGTFTDLATMEISTATGNGNVLEATDGDAKGLQISFSGTSTGTYGSVSFTVGIAEQLDRLLTRTTDSLEGPIHNAVEGYQSDIRTLKQDIDALQQRLLQRERYLIQQFSKANEALQQMQFLQTSLASQLAALL
jgi:flagellar hook-associated protein 2